MKSFNKYCIICKNNAFQVISILTLFVLIFASFTCKTPTEPGNNNQVNISVEDFSSTEAWIKVNSNEVDKNTKIILSRSGNVVAAFNSTAGDTVIYDNSLLPNKTYNYSVVLDGKDGRVSELKDISLTTLDTTSHDYTWQTFTFGEVGAGNSYFKDVSIIDANNIWAAGAIYKKDSSGNSAPVLFNVAHWSGNKWDLERIEVQFRGNMIILPLSGIQAFTYNNLWLIGSLPIHGNGTDWNIFDLRTSLDPNISLLKGWGNNSNNIYLVGMNGNIVNYLNSQWNKMESGTTINLLDISGNKDNDIWACGYSIDYANSCIHAL